MACIKILAGTPDTAVKSGDLFRALTVVAIAPVDSGWWHLATTDGNKEIEDYDKRIIDHSKKMVYLFNGQSLKIVFITKANCKKNPPFNMKQKDTLAWI